MPWSRKCCYVPSVMHAKNDSTKFLPEYVKHSRLSQKIAIVAKISFENLGERLTRRPANSGIFSAFQIAEKRSNAVVRTKNVWKRCKIASKIDLLSFFAFFQNSKSTLNKSIPQSHQSKQKTNNSALKATGRLSIIMAWSLKTFHGSTKQANFDVFRFLEAINPSPTHVTDKCIYRTRPDM